MVFLFLLLGFTHLFLQEDIITFNAPFRFFLGKMLGSGERLGWGLVGKASVELGGLTKPKWLITPMYPILQVVHSQFYEPFYPKLQVDPSSRRSLGFLGPPGCEVSMEQSSTGPISGCYVGLEFEGESKKHGRESPGQGEVFGGSSLVYLVSYVVSI